MTKPKPPWRFSRQCRALELSLQFTGLIHSITRENGFYVVTVREKMGETWWLCSKKSLKEAQEAVLWHIDYFSLYKNGKWVWGRGDLNYSQRRPPWL